MKNNVICVDFTAKHKRRKKIKKFILSIVKKCISIFHSSRKDNKPQSNNQSAL